MSDDNPHIEVAFGDREDLSTEEIPGRFDLLMDETRKFFDALGLHKDLMLDILRSNNDWTFVLKIDALLESAVKELIKGTLKLEVLGRSVGEDGLSDFIDSLPINGRTSLLHLLRASGCPDEDANFIESIRQIRNGYAHNIRLADLSLISVINLRNTQDRSRIIKNICNISSYEEKSLIEHYERDGGFLRFGIADATMRILLYAFHIAIKGKDQTGKKDGLS